MSKDVLTSVNKEHLDNILDGIKTIEWRKKPLPLGKHYGYETKNKGGCGKVTGEFEVVENIKVDLFDIVCDDPKELVKKGCVDWGFLNKYAGKQDYLYANVIKNAKRYDKPKELSEFKTFCRDAYCQDDCGTPTWFCKDGYGSCAVKDKELAYPYNDECIYFDCPTYGECCEYEAYAYCLCNGLKPITRPPQSWCYVEVQNGNNT